MCSTPIAVQKQHTCTLGSWQWCALFNVDTFTVYPYQLGYGNDEGLKSGAWWFYQKLGFRARAPRCAAHHGARVETDASRPLAPFVA